MWKADAMERFSETGWRDTRGISSAVESNLSFTKRTKLGPDRWNHRRGWCKRTTFEGLLIPYPAEWPIHKEAWICFWLEKYDMHGVELMIAAREKLAAAHEAQDQVSLIQ